MSRLIDTDMLENMYKEEFYTPLTDIGSYNKGWNDCIDAIMKEEPTVDAVPVVHGHWIETEESYSDEVMQSCICSNCKRRSIRPLGDYCRWCGALMDEVTKNG